MNRPSPTSFAEIEDSAFTITAGATNALTARLAAAGLALPHVIADLAVAALAMRLSPEEAVNLATSSDAVAVLEAFAPPESPEALARREAEAEGKLIVLRFDRR